MKNILLVNCIEQLELRDFLTKRAKALGYDYFTHSEYENEDIGYRPYFVFYLDKTPQDPRYYEVPVFSCCYAHPDSIVVQEGKEVSVQYMLEELQKNVERSKQKPITFKDGVNKVTITLDGSVTYGCTTVSSEVVDKILEKRRELLRY